MRILHVARRYWPAVGGIESFLRLVATEQAKRHEVTVLAQRIDDGPHTRLSDSLSPPPTFDEFEDGGVRVRPLRVPVGRRAAMAPLVTHTIPFLRRYAYGRLRVPSAALVARAVGPIIAREAEAADVVHMWAGDLLASAAVRAAKIAGIPVAVTPFAHRDQWGYDPASLRAYRSADAVLALLETEADLYREHGVPDRAIAISGVCAPPVPRIDEADAKRRLGITGPLALFLGARRSYKGYDLLLSAAPQIAAAIPEARIAFVGPGEPLPESGAASNVIDVGLVDEDEKSLWLNAANLLCLPSSAEILPSSILEAWSVGTPALTSDIPPLRELLETHRGGVVVRRDADEIAATLIELLADPDRLRQLGEAGRTAWQSHFTPDHVARWHEALYSAAASGDLTRERQPA